MCYDAYDVCDYRWGELCRAGVQCLATRAKKEEEREVVGAVDNSENEEDGGV